MPDESKVRQPVPYYSPGTLSAIYNDLIGSADPRLAGDIDYYIEQISAMSHVLELGCGSGRVTIPLSGKSYVTGVDISPHMLRIAEAKQKTLPQEQAARICLMCADMAEVRVRSLFDTIISPYYSFNHLPNVASLMGAMKVISVHLEPNGRAYVHILSAASLSEPLRPGGSRWNIKFNQNGEDRILKWEPLSHTIDRQNNVAKFVIRLSVCASGGARSRSSVEELTYVWFSDSDIVGAAHDAGLRLLETKVLNDDKISKIYVLGR